MDILLKAVQALLNMGAVALLPIMICIPAKIIKSTMTEIPAKQADVDIVMVTTNYRQKLEKPLIKVFGLISGINEDKIRDEIIETCHRLQNEN